MTKVQFLSTLFPTAHKVDTVMDVGLHTPTKYVNKAASNKNNIPQKCNNAFG